MQFKKEVQDLFKKAGWFSGRDVRSQFDTFPHFHEYPLFLKEFLYEYGGLKVPTTSYKAERKSPIMDFNAIFDGFPDDVIMGMLSEGYENDTITVFCFAYYSADNTTLECDAQGNIYLNGDWPVRVSTNFKTGIEKVMMEDFLGTLVWNPNTSEWVDKY